MKQEDLERPKNHVCIRWKSYKGLEFAERETVREELSAKLKAFGIRFLEYCWVWDEDDRCLLVAGTYERMEDARQWIKTLESMGFEITVRTSLPGEDPERAGIRRGWERG